MSVGATYHYRQAAKETFKGAAISGIPLLGNRAIVALSEHMGNSDLTTLNVSCFAGPLFAILMVGTLFPKMRGKILRSDWFIVGMLLTMCGTPMPLCKGRDTNVVHFMSHIATSAFTIVGTMFGELSYQETFKLD